MRARRDLLPDIASLLEIDGAKPVEPCFQHQRPFRLQVDRALRHTGGDAHRMPLFDLCRLGPRCCLGTCSRGPDPAPSQRRVPRVGAGTLGHGRIAPADPQLVIIRHLEGDRATQPVAAKPGEQVVGPRDITVQHKSVIHPQDHHVGKNPSLRCQQGAGPGFAGRERLHIRSQDRLQKVGRFRAADPDRPPGRIMCRTSCHVAHAGYCLSVISPS